MNDNRGKSPGVTGATPGSRPQGRGTPEHPVRADDPAARARETLDDAKQQVRSLGHEAKEQGKAALSRNKDAAAGQVSAAAAALHSAADELQERDQAKAGRFVAYAAEQLETFGQRMRNRDLDTMIDDAARMGRRSPAAFFAGSVAVGLLLSRFLKSSQAAPRRDRSDETAAADARAASSESASAAQPYPAGPGPVVGATATPAGTAPYGSPLPHSGGASTTESQGRDATRPDVSHDNRSRE